MEFDGSLVSRGRGLVTAQELTVYRGGESSSVCEWVCVGGKSGGNGKT